MLLRTRSEKSAFYCGSDAGEKLSTMGAYELSPLALPWAAAEHSRFAVRRIVLTNGLLATRLDVHSFDPGSRATSIMPRNASLSGSEPHETPHPYGFALSARGRW